MRNAVIAVVGAVVLVAGVGLRVGANFGYDQIHRQLAAQQIVVPEASSLEETPGMLPYAGEKVTTGDAAKAYADEFIGVHLDGIAGGQTYSQVSFAAMQDPDNAKLAEQKQSLFMGTTLRSMLLGAYGWDLLAHIAADVANALLALGVALLAFAAWARRKAV